MRTLSCRRLAASASMVLIGTLVPTVSGPASQPALATNETVVNTGISGAPIEVEGAQSGIGVIVAAGPAGEPTVVVRQPGGTVDDLGEGDAPSFWLGGTVDPVLIGTVTERAGSDLNADGDENDVVLVSSAGGAPFLPISGAPVTIDTRCLARVNDLLGVACLSESAASDDVNNDGDMADLEMVLIHDDGSFELTGEYVENLAVDVTMTTTRLPDGSVGIGSARVMPNGTMSIVTSVVDAQIDALLGTSLVVRSSASGLTYLVPTAGAPILVGAGLRTYQVGAAVWVNHAASDGLCRLRADATTSCLGVTAIWDILSFYETSPNVVPLADDAAVVFGRAPGDDPKVTRVYRVLPGQPAQYLGLDADRSYALADGTALAVGKSTVRISVSTADLHAGELSTPLSDGRALLARAESPGVDLNADGDTSDIMTSLLADGTSRGLGLTAVAGISIGDPGVLLAVGEVNGGDLNDDGDDDDVVAAVYDGNTVHNLGLAVGSSAGNPQAIRLAWTGAGTALIGVSETAQGLDLDGDGAIAGLVTFAVAYQPSAPRPVFDVVTPTRLLDTRTDGPQIGYAGTKPTAGQTIEVTAPAGARTIMMNVTGTNAEQDGFVTVWPCGEPRPGTSSLNVSPGVITPNLVISKVGADGKVCLFTQRAADLIADLAGTAAASAPYLGLTPVRLLDTRPDSAVNYANLPKPGQGTIVVILVPAQTDAVVLNVTGVEPDGGYVTAYPCGQPIPPTSNLNLTPGVISSNLVVAQVGSDPRALTSDAAVCLFTQRSAHLVVDMVGLFFADPSFAAAEPVRLVDTRAESQVGYTGSQPAAGDVIQVTAPTGATAIAMNLTGLNSTETGFVTAYPCGETRPLASNLNLTPGRITPNMAISKVGADGKVCIFTQRSADLVVDLAGAFNA